ncbi:MAG: hypothetical protein WAX38_02440 [Minisyncoccia bacterium]
MNIKCALIAFIAYLVLLMIVVTSGMAHGSSDIVSMLLVLVAIGVYKLCAVYEPNDKQEEKTIKE